jgi:hypothetical protein
LFEKVNSLILKAKSPGMLTKQYDKKQLSHRRTTIRISNTSLTTTDIPTDMR